jgi:hypothetical protein
VSYDQTFKGRLTFADAHCLEAGLDGFAMAAKDSIVGVDDLEIGALTVGVDMDCSAPASTYEETQSALQALAEHAAAGTIKTTFVLDGTSHESIGAGKRRSAAGLPPRHHRWELYRAAMAGDAKGLRRLAKAGVALDQAFPAFPKRTVLHFAAEGGKAEAIGVLIEAGLDPNGPSPPLAKATTGEAAKRLLEAGADPNATVNKDKWPLLCLAANRGREDVFAVLLAAGAKLPEANHAEVVLDCARHGWLDALSALVKRQPAIGKQIAAPAVMKAAVRSGNSVLVDLVLEHGGVLPDTFLADAVDSGSVALVETALRAPGAIAACGPSSARNDAMCRAADRYHLPVMKLLAKHGVPVHPAEPFGTSPLHIAVRCGEDDPKAVAVVRWLLANGAPANAKTDDGEVPMTDAKTWGSKKIIALLRAKAKAKKPAEKKR